MAVEVAFPSESITQWALEGLGSAVDHLNVWADHSLPMSWEEGFVVHTKGYRWIYTLIRSALEGTAQSLWLTRSAHSHEAVARMVRMIRHDLDEQAKAWRAMGRDPSAITARELELSAVATALEEHGKPVKKLPAMVDLIRLAGEAISEDPDRYEAAYRVCSAATHGKGWAVGELTQQTVQREWRPGQFLTESTADPDRLTDLLETAASLLDAAAGLYLKRCGYDETRDFIGAALEVTRKMPQKDDGALLAAYEREHGYDTDQ